MLSHIGLLWTPQALLLWDRARRVAARPSLPPAEGAAALRLFSLRRGGGRSAGGARALADQPALAKGLGALGFLAVGLDELSLAQKLATLSRAESLVLE